VTAIFNRRSVCCRRCGLAGYCGRQLFDWGRYRLGVESFKAICFLLCMRCGITHAFGSQDILVTGSGPLFGQPAPLRLERTKRSSGGILWSGEWDDCVSDEAEYVQSAIQPCGPPDWQDRGNGVCVADGMPCVRCGSAGELADLYVYERRPVSCPGCGEASLESFRL
jgi:hypothetical protein